MYVGVGVCQSNFTRHEMFSFRLASLFGYGVRMSVSFVGGTQVVYSIAFANVV